MLLKLEGSRGQVSQDKEGSITSCHQPPRACLAVIMRMRKSWRQPGRYLLRRSLNQSAKIPVSPGSCGRRSSLCQGGCNRPSGIKSWHFQACDLAARQASQRTKTFFFHFLHSKGRSKDEYLSRSWSIAVCYLAPIRSHPSSSSKSLMHLG